jgi:aspartate racemase
MELLLPDKSGQNEVMDVIYNQVKCGILHGADTIRHLAGKLIAAGADTVVLGCTELSLLDLNDSCFTDPMKCTALKSVELCSERRAESVS